MPDPASIEGTDFLIETWVTDPCGAVLPGQLEAVLPGQLEAVVWPSTRGTFGFGSTRPELAEAPASSVGVRPRCGTFLLAVDGGRRTRLDAEETSSGVVKECSWNIETDYQVTELTMNCSGRVSVATVMNEKTRPFPGGLAPPR